MRKTFPPERQVIESLRAGVPSLGAVHALGSAQPDIEEAFAGLLGRVADGAPAGLVVGGGFGSGKSHLLRHLGLLAGTAGFVVSHVVVSKETPLYDPAKVAWTALDGAVVPGGASGPAVEVLAAALDPDSPEFGRLMVSVSAPSAGLDPRFAATLLLFARLKDTGEEFVESIVRFWAGEALSTPELRRQLRAVDEKFTFGRIAPKELARQRLRFIARLMTAAGHRGWIILFDEVELIARYSLVSRAKAYAEIGRWCAGTRPEPGVPIGTVFALTDDFPAAVLAGKREAERIPARLRARQKPELAELAEHAVAGMTVVAERMLLLTPPDDAELDRAYERIKQLHANAFDWLPPDVPGLERSASNRMRQYVRAWINEWDLICLDSSYRPSSRTVELPATVVVTPD
ncbi:MAG TPA: BREX system ATP-binding domain-containing protein [Actinophytocola sp.]|uniref:BREX system ATP-binding domain-containing protein n=1 Tax=Actinophytocola sp. TaxID=1872138 RepID=UPI002DB87421|nr:BREX system ATP-binding domain-containing protein [Actinophytocola sp.]HEU5469372.1 BREX system ATP-binding domain-containing protein [Actinophytocola sp.]